MEAQLKSSREAVAAMLAEVGTLDSPAHITKEILEEVNTLIDRCQGASIQNFLYNFKRCVDLLVVKPLGQQRRYITVSKLEFNKKNMYDWRFSGSSYLAEVRLFEGRYLDMNEWIDMPMTDKLVCSLLGIDY